MFQLVERFVTHMEFEIPKNVSMKPITESGVCKHLFVAFLNRNSLMNEMLYHRRFGRLVWGTTWNVLYHMECRVSYVM